MAAAEIIPGIYVVRGKFAGEFGFIASYLIIDESEVLVIDPGTAGDPGDRIVKAIKDFGLDPKTDVVGIVCTHGHPDHSAGAGRLKRTTNAPIMIHKGDEELLHTPAAFLNKRLIMEKSERFSMKFDKGPLRVNYRGIEADQLITHGQNLTKLGADHIFPAHDSPHIFGDARLQFEAVKDGVVHLQDTLLTLLGARGDADIEQFVFDIRQTRSVPIPKSYDALLTTTIHVTLVGLKEAGLVRELGSGVWTRAG
jgi:glyoxylase-like metal-dependent hydrolase (beta-lactamase superfamily II)